MAARGHCLAGRCGDYRELGSVSRSWGLHGNHLAVAGGSDPGILRAALASICRRARRIGLGFTRKMCPVPACCRSLGFAWQGGENLLIGDCEHPVCGRPAGSWPTVKGSARNPGGGLIRPGSGVGPAMGLVLNAS